MSLIVLGGSPLIPIGLPLRAGTPAAVALTNTLMDAANEAIIMVGRVITEDGASHTIDTSGSSSLGWRANAVTFANAGTTVKVGLATIDSANGPPMRAGNSTNVINFDVSKSMTGGGAGITANAWQEHVPDTGTKTIANGDLVAFCVQATARAGADAVNAACAGSPVFNVLPAVTNYTGGSYSDASELPNAVITFSDGKIGYFLGGYVASVGSTTQTWNSGSATKEYGNYFSIPVPCTVYGLCGAANFGGDADVVLYTDPLGTPVSAASVSVDLNTIGTANVGSVFHLLFATPFPLLAGQTCAAILKPTSVTNVSMGYKTFNAAAHQKTEPLGANGYAINRASGAFAAQNSNKDRFAIGLLVGAFSQENNHLINSQALIG